MVIVYGQLGFNVVFKDFLQIKITIRFALKKSKHIFKGYKFPHSILSMKYFFVVSFETNQRYTFLIRKGFNCIDINV